MPNSRLGLPDYMAPEVLTVMNGDGKRVPSQTVIGGSVELLLMRCLWKMPIH